MGVIIELTWIPFNEGNRKQLKAASDLGDFKVAQLECKNEHGNEWQLFVPNKPGSLYFRTENEAKTAADLEYYSQIKFKYLKGKVEVLNAVSAPTKRATVEFLCFLSDVDPVDPTANLVNVLNQKSLRLDKLEIDEDRTLYGFHQSLKMEMTNDLKSKRHWESVYP